MTQRNRHVLVPCLFVQFVLYSHRFSGLNNQGHVKLGYDMTSLSAQYRQYAPIHRVTGNLNYILVLTVNTIPYQTKTHSKFLETASHTIFKDQQSRIQCKQHTPADWTKNFSQCGEFSRVRDQAQSHFSSNYIYA